MAASPNPPTRRSSPGALYFHDRCFDGLVSGVLASEFLERSAGWRIEHLQPVTYDARDSWLSSSLLSPAAVVDFPYHPQAEFWADHHTTTFLSPQAQADYQQRKTTAKHLWFDDQAPSCASLLWDKVRTCLSDPGRYQEIVLWADKIDSAAYVSVDEAIWGDSPAQQISSSLAEGDPNYSRLLLASLRTQEMNDVAKLPAVSNRFREWQRRIRAGAARVEGRVRFLEGEVASFDVPIQEDEIVSRYLPYRFFPQARYSIGVVRSPHGDVRITTMRNPWKHFESIQLGRILAEYGGGGHQRVAAVILPQPRAWQTETIVNRLLSEMRASEPVERVTA